MVGKRPGQRQRQADRRRRRLSKTRKHKAGTVAMAHPGDVRASDSQIYIAMRPMPNLDGKHNIIGEVKSGMAIVPKLAVADIIKKVTVIEAPAGT